MPGRGIAVRGQHAVVAVSANNLWAVGNYGNGIPIVYSTLIEHWDGSAWSIVPSPNQGTGNSNYLAGVAAVSANNLWAVGYYNNGTANQTLTEHWDGSSWTIVPSPNQGTGDNYLEGVARVSSSDVWAVGYYNNGTATQTLAEHWNGTAWSVVSSSSPGTTANIFEGVTAVATNDVWAVGYSSSGREATLTEHWDGSSWSAVFSNPSTQPNYLTSAVAISSNNVWAAGYSNDCCRWQTLMVHWNGSSWSPGGSVNGPGNNNLLTGMSAAIAGNNVWAVGYDYDSTPQTLTEHWDGSAWTLVPSPNQGTNSNYLQGVAAISLTEAWTVGYYYDNNAAVYHTLVEHLASGCAGPGRAGKK